jgi:RNA polymerase sigma-70 factor (ECF subfamily)
MNYDTLDGRFLAELCTENDSCAWNEFVRRFRRPLSIVILRVMQRWCLSSRALIDDFLQETYMALCAHDFRLLRGMIQENSASIDALLRSVAANVTHDQIRARSALKRGGKFHQLDQDISQLEDEFARDQTEVIMTSIQLDEIDQLLKNSTRSAVGERSRSIFWLHFRMGMSSKAISRIGSLSLTEKGVQSSLYRAVQLIRRDSLTRILQ